MTLDEAKKLLKECETTLSYLFECEIESIWESQKVKKLITKIQASLNKPERIGKWWIERDKERCVEPYHCGNCDIYGSYIGHSSISKYCPVCGIKMDISKVYEYEEATKEARQSETD